MTITRRKLMVGTAALTAASLPITARASDPEERQLLAAWRRLSDGHRALIHNFTRRLAGLGWDEELTRRTDAEEPPRTGSHARSGTVIDGPWAG